MPRSVFLSILILIMCDDPSNLSDYDREYLIFWADQMSRKSSYANWVEAYHNNCKCMPDTIL